MIEHEGLLIIVGMTTVISAIILATAAMKIATYYAIARIMLVSSILGSIFLGEMHVSGRYGNLFWPTIVYFGAIALALIAAYRIRTK
ncbi:hypothetical protein [Halocynthiibacter styelae]|uniref:Uncharacterized protein n=1 Tax=Halocynthiibacter styelae TaxID=2761955 RepID=A0A8J7LKQ0_9RHOB|nr:hypothetical protein [Paenihalocynthiibacter styelae]MBI1493104.1 hypothetical protein [Paenihalocynthiibacter styelae]